MKTTIYEQGPMLTNFAREYVLRRRGPADVKVFIEYDCSQDAAVVYMRINDKKTKRTVEEEGAVSAILGMVNELWPLELVPS